MGYLQVFTNAIVVALMAMYVYENQRRNGDVLARLDRIEKELDIDLFAESKERKKIHMIYEQIEDMKKLMSTRAGKEELNKVQNQQKSDIRKLVEIEDQQLKNNDKGVTYIRWGKTQCDGPSTETIYSGQVGGGHYSHSGASADYICLPNNPDVAQPLKSNDAYLYGAEYQIFDFSKPDGIRSGISDHDVACAACLAKGKISSIMIPGRKKCYTGWTKEYEGILTSGYYKHAAASNFACLDKDTEVIAGGSKNDDGKLFYTVKTVCGSLKCPPYAADTEVLCVVCSK